MFAIYLYLRSYCVRYFRLDTLLGALDCYPSRINHRRSPMVVRDPSSIV
jgi:hypothetical protein